MRYAIISDVHANEAALRAVLTDAADAHAEKVICLGDVLGYGPDPVAALELVYRRAHVCLAGNHDDAVSGRFPVDDFSSFAAAAVKRHRAALSPEAIDWLRHLPHVCEFGGGSDGAACAFACAHGEFSDPKGFAYVLEAEDALPSWMERAERLLFVGHSHKPGIFVLGESGVPHALEPADFMVEPGKRYLVNVGSVGYPRAGACRSFYCIYDDCSRTVFFRSLPFDIEAYGEKMHGKGLDEAPWMRAHEKERRGHEVRRAANFANASFSRRISARKPPAAAEAEGAAKSALHAPRWVVAAAALLFAVSAAVAWGVLSTRSGNAPGKGGRASALVAMAEKESGGAVPSRTFANGWMASFERADGQSAEFVEGRGLFKIASTPHGTVRLVKSIPLSEGRKKVYWAVRLVSPPPGKALPFEFGVRMLFHGADGALLGMRSAKARRSARNRQESVPVGAVRATMEVDCSCDGTYDVAEPYFASVPEAGQSVNGRSETGRRRR